MVLGKRPTNGH